MKAATPVRECVPCVAVGGGRAPAAARRHQVIRHTAIPRRTGDMLKNGVGLVAVIWAGQVFPFDFIGSVSDATVLTRTVVRGVGAVIGVIVVMVRCTHAIRRPGAGPAPRAPRTRTRPGGRR